MGCTLYGLTNSPPGSALKFIVWLGVICMYVLGLKYSWKSRLLDPSRDYSLFFQAVVVQQQLSPKICFKHAENLRLSFSVQWTSLFWRFFCGQLEDHRKSFLLCEKQCLHTAGTIASRVVYFITHTCEQESKTYIFFHCSCQRSGRLPFCLPYLWCVVLSRCSELHEEASGLRARLAKIVLEHWSRRTEEDLSFLCQEYLGLFLEF